MASDCDYHRDADVIPCVDESSHNQPEADVAPPFDESRADEPKVDMDNHPEVVSTPLVSCSLCRVKMKASNLPKHEKKCLGVGTLDCPKCHRPMGTYGFEQHVMECRPIPLR